MSAPLNTVSSFYSLDFTPFGTAIVTLLFVPNDFVSLSAAFRIVGFINVGTWVLFSVEVTGSLLLELLSLLIWILFALFVTLGSLLKLCGGLGFEVFCPGSWQLTEIVTVPFADAVCFAVPFWRGSCKGNKYNKVTALSRILTGKLIVTQLVKKPEGLNHQSFLPQARSMR